MIHFLYLLTHCTRTVSFLSVHRSRASVVCIFTHFHSFLKSTFVSQISQIQTVDYRMSQHGETSESSGTRPSLETSNAQETFGLQAEVISNCIELEVIQQFRTGKVMKPKQWWAWPHSTLCLSPFHCAFTIVCLLACGSALIRTHACEIQVLSYPLSFPYYLTLTTFLPFQRLFSQPYPSAIAFYTQVSRFEEKNHMSGHIITICGSAHAHTSLW